MSYESVVNQIFKSPTFETERLVVGWWDEALAESAFAIYGDPEIAKWLSGIPEPSVEQMRERIRFLIDRNAGWLPHFGSWPTFLKSNRELVGANLMKPIPDAEGKATEEIEIGWHLARSQWGHGYATEGAQKMIEIAFGEIGLARLVAVTKLDNTASQNVMKRLGMTHVGQTNQYYGQTLELFELRPDQAGK